MADGSNSDNSSAITAEELTDANELNEDGLEVESIEMKYYKIMARRQEVHTVEELFRGMDPQIMDNLSEHPYCVTAIFYSPQYWGLPVEMLDRRCDLCGDIGNLACFSSFFRRWLLKGFGQRERDDICSRCGDKGHNNMSCPLPITFDWPRRFTSVRTPLMVRYGPSHFEGEQIPSPQAILPRRRNRCGRCGELGHNRRSCNLFLLEDD